VHLSRIDRKYANLTVTATDEDDLPVTLTAVDVALIPPRSTPTGATTWTPQPPRAASGGCSSPDPTPPRPAPSSSPAPRTCGSG
jgi:hypothetical protein